jgi:predicted transcriptional regulator
VALAHEGHTQTEIAEALKITQPAVSKILRRLDEAVAREVLEARVRTLAGIVRHLDHVTREALRQHAATKNGVTRQRQVKKSAPNGTTTVTQEVVVQKHGDPRWIELARRAVETKVAVTAALSQTDAHAADRRGDTESTDSQVLTQLSDTTLEHALADLTQSSPATQSRTKESGGTRR